MQTSAIIAIIIAIVIVAIIAIIILAVMRSRAESFSTSDADIARIIAGVNTTQKSKGTIFDFARLIGDSAFPPIKYAQLVTLYKSGRLDTANTRAVLSEAA